MRPIHSLALVLAASLTLAACDEQSRNTAGTGAAAGTIGVIGAKLLGANDAWTVAAGAAAAAAGVLYAQNRQTNQCAYYTGNTLPNGDAEVVTRPCQ